LKGFKVAPDLTLPRESISWVITFIAKRNAGKTYNSAVYVEQLVQGEVPTLVIDGMGTWWGLRKGVNDQGEPDDSKPGLPVVIIGGNHADIKLDPSKVERIVEALLQTNTSAVLDISQFRKGDQMRIAMIFAEELYRLAEKYPAERVLVVEEADMFAPQKPFKEEARCLGAFEDLVKRGGNRNIGLVEITQRSADFNKNLLTQSDMLIVGRTTAPQDKEAIQAWVEKHSEKNKKALEEWFDSLSSLGKGEVWVWNDDEAWPIFKRVQFQKRITFHATRKFVLTKQAENIKLMDVAEFIEKFRDKFEPKPKPQPESKAPETLRSRVREFVHPPPVVTMPRAAEAPSLRLKAEPTPQPRYLDERVQQTLPNILLEKVRPVVQVLVEEPSTSLGRVLVVLTNHDGRDDRWTGAKIKTVLRDHAWPDDGLNETIDDLLRWEILRRQSNNYLKFYRDRVTVTERRTELQGTV
jgi:hypothetical protein